MGVMKRLAERGMQRPRGNQPIPAHGGMYRIEGESGYQWCGQGPRPDWRPTFDQLIRAGINPGAWAVELLAKTGLDLCANLADRPPAPRKSDEPAPYHVRQALDRLHAIDRPSVCERRIRQSDAVGQARFGFGSEA